MEGERESVRGDRESMRGGDQQEGGVWPVRVLECGGAKASDERRRSRAAFTFLILSSSSESILLSYFDGRFLVLVGLVDIVKGL